METRSSAGDESLRSPYRPSAAQPLDFDRAPFLVIWETTQACDLACVHCRAEARPDRDPAELSTAEAKAMMGRIRSFGRPLLVLTGGDPAKRPDLVELVAHGAELGLRMGLTPSGTRLVTPELIATLRKAGLSRFAVSLDGPTAERHDRFRGVSGSYRWTMEMLRAAKEVGLSTQVNTTVTRQTLADFDAMEDVVRRMGISLWSVFFLVPTGRAGAGDLPSPEEFERVFHRMHEISTSAPFDLKSTAAPQYRRVVLQRRVAKRRAGASKEEAAAMVGESGLRVMPGAPGGRGVNDGSGFLFISHRGDIYPSGFLPVSAGNIRLDDPVEVYRNHELFRALRDPDRLKGKCGVCEYRTVCGGSRARAWALTGDPLEADPLCLHVPRLYQNQVQRGEAEDVESYFTRRIPGWGGNANGAGSRGIGLPVVSN